MQDSEQKNLDWIVGGISSLPNSMPVNRSWIQNSEPTINVPWRCREDTEERLTKMEVIPVLQNDPWCRGITAPWNVDGTTIYPRSKQLHPTRVRQRISEDNGYQLILSQKNYNKRKTRCKIRMYTSTAYCHCWRKQTRKYLDESPMENDY
jgi:hypothetical protein